MDGRFISLAEEVTLSPIQHTDCMLVAEFHAMARLATDRNLVPGYIEASIKSGHFQKKWNAWGSAPPATDIALKVMDGNDIVAIVLAGHVEAPAMLNVAANDIWGEFHHHYIRPDFQGRGFGRRSCPWAWCNWWRQPVKDPGHN